jgi:signal transduction histidine kinase
VRERELLFAGKITAGMTHEVNNVLATIKESSGLMHDIITLRKKDFFSFLKKKDDAAAHHDKFMSIIGTIGEQVSRGVVLTKSLNKFAHTLDTAGADVDINELMELTAVLLGRFLRTKRVTLKSVPLAKPRALRTDPFRLLLALDAMIEHSLAATPPRGEIELRPRVLEREMEICVAPSTTADEPADLPDTRAALGEILTILKATLAPAPDGVPGGLLLSLPLE